VKKRIIWLIDGLGPGGAERSTLSILGHFDREKFDLRVCVLQVKHNNPVRFELERIGIPVDMVSVPNLRHPGNLPHILGYLKSQHPDLIHTQLEFSNTLGSLAGMLLGVPSVSTIHTLETPQKGTSEYWRLQIMWASLRYFSKRIIAVSESTRLHHMRVGRLPEHKMITIYNGIDLFAFTKSHQDILDAKRKLLNLPTNAIILLTVAVLREPKGIQYLIKALPALVQKFPNLYYLVVGDGEYKGMLEKIVKEASMEEHVIFAGQRNDVREMLALSDVFVLPTLTDALPTVLIEALAAELPIVASNVGGVPEIVTHELNGLLVPPADSVKLTEACLRLVQDKDTAREMATSGLKIAKERFDIHDQVKILSHLYEELLAGR
jgi:glycosyltransferase involved in cell wall biosynthesis